MTTPLQKAHRFKFLSQCLAFPNEAFIPALNEALGKIDANRDELLALVAAFEREETEPLQAEYTRLFLNGYPRTVCPPYESVYLEKRMHGDAAVAVAAAYAEWEMSVEPGLIDHLATELEFLAFLASAESLDNAISADARKASERFTQQHMSRWTPQFTADLQAGAKLDAYRMLAELMESTLTPLHPKS
ncbi:molecular chaperone TorD family protein [Chlorobaculum thiosulfatiphilum]|uniref:Molecular chaperone TorD family protein n=1 Tax=Chlorobaculum thiosulfatiphilum TaxID=115852 RepID=A0A5C4S830_CHLTI|nr:molecular chaperone TorD family protein [Chlorobaculum thiosulfatiphilum]TNJ39307.1 molecular chaperone TorD family protein [Chlorobaculum thiosulfatiphilum]